MIHIQRLDAPIDTKDPEDEKIVSMTENRPYLMGYGDTNMRIWFSSSILFPITDRNGGIVFRDDYSTVTYDDESKVLEIGGEASSFVTYDQATKTLVFSRKKG